MSSFLIFIEAAVRGSTAFSNKEDWLRGMNGNELNAIISSSAAFRDAIVRSHGGGLLALQNFPVGACGDASILLGQFFADRGLGEWFYVNGERTAASGKQTHAWIERDGLVVDITANQFIEIDDPVLVTNAKDWHLQFAEDTRHAAVINIYLDDHTRDRLWGAYELIKRAII